MNRDALVNNEIYHIFNRGADKRNVFLDVVDFIRFTNGLYEFNDAEPSRDSRDVKVFVPRTKLVDILCYCLMPNHFHLMLRQIQDGGITRYMRKLGTGYSMYFNKKYKRSGVLFQGKFKSVSVATDAYMRYLPHYIHLNPLELEVAGWKDRGLGGLAREHLRSYRWSSYPEYIGASSARLTDTEFLNELYAPAGYDVALDEWVREFDASSLSSVAID